MLNKIYRLSFIAALIALPLISFAQLTNTDKFFGKAKDIVSNTLVPLVFTLALLIFFWGVAKFIWSEGQGKDEGKKIMIWGIVALFVMSCVWGIVRFIEGELLPGTSPDSMPVPTINTSIGV